MRARIVPATNGARWLGEGWRLFRAAPLGWLSLVFVYLFGTQLVAIVPVIGMVVALVAFPGLNAGLMVAARAAAQHRDLRVAMLVEPFRSGARVQLVLGAVYLGCIMLVFAVAVLADGDGALRAAVSGGAAPQALEGADWAGAVLALAALYVPVALLFWFAPVLAAWHGAGAAKALFFSFFACLINWRAFLLYGALAAALTVAVVFVFLALPVALLGGDKAKAAPLVLPLAVLMLPTFFGSFYAGYRDIFGGEE